MTVEELNHILSDHLLWLSEKSTGAQADFRGKDLSGLDLSWANLAGANLAGANLTDANLSHADLSNANLAGAILTGANLTGSNLDGADYEIGELEKADFESKPRPRETLREEPAGEVSEGTFEPVIDEVVKEKVVFDRNQAGAPLPDFSVKPREDQEERGPEEEAEFSEEEEISAPPSPPKLSPPTMTPPFGGMVAPGKTPEAMNAADKAWGAKPSPKRRSPFAAIGSAISGIFKKENREVAVSSFVPGQIVREEPFTIQCWVHWENAREEVKKRAESSGHAAEAGAKSGLVIEKGALVELSIKPVSLIDIGGRREPQTKTIRWEGYPSDEEFVFVWPTGAPDVIYETVEVSVEGIPLGDCTLRLRIDQNNSENIVSEFKRIKRAFVSYAHDDSQRVLASVQAFQTVTNIDLFLDVDDLRAGVDWEKKLRSEVSTRDALFLYWSKNAAQSEWVEREWRLALEERGVTYIKPMPLDPIAPPEELSQLQFADKWARLAEYQRLKKAAG